MLYALARHIFMFPQLQLAHMPTLDRHLQPFKAKRKLQVRSTPPEEAREREAHPHIKGETKRLICKISPDAPKLANGFGAVSDRLLPSMCCIPNLQRSSAGWQVGRSQ